MAESGIRQSQTKLGCIVIIIISHIEHDIPKQPQNDGCDVSEGIENVNKQKNGTTPDMLISNS